MRRRLSRGVTLTALTAAACLTALPAGAQHAKKPKNAAGAQAPSAAPVDMDADPAASGKAAGKKGAPGKTGAKGAKAPIDTGGTPTPGTPSEAAAQAKHLYESEKWWDAAQALFAVSSGETGDDEGNKQLAQFNLAKALYKLKFYQAAYSIFSEIADKPSQSSTARRCCGWPSSRPTFPSPLTSSSALASTTRVRLLASITRNSGSSTGS